MPVACRRCILAAAVLLAAGMSRHHGGDAPEAGVLGAAAVWERWHADLQRHGRRPDTVKRYRQVWWSWAGFLDDKGRRWDRATPRDLEAFLRRRPLAANTAASYATGVRQAYRWAARAGVLRADRMAMAAPVRGGRPEARALTRGELDHLFACIDADRWWRTDAAGAGLNTTGANRRRVRLVVSLAYWCALRAGEIARARREDVRLRGVQPCILVPDGKGGRRGVVPLADPIRALLAAAFDADDAYAWTGAGPIVESLRWPGEHVQPQCVSELGARVLHAAGIPETLHALRHSAATVMLEEHPDRVLAVSRVLRHSSSRVTEETYTVSADVGAAELVGSLYDPRARR